MSRLFRASGKLLAAAATLTACLCGGASCSSSEQGIEVELWLASPASPPVQRGTRVFESDRGYEVSLTRGYLAVASLELEPCPSTARLSDIFGVSVASAHSESSPTRLGNPGVIWLVEPLDHATLLGTLEPPPGDYCGLSVDLDAADSDAAALPDDFDFVGLTLYLEGTYSLAGGEPTPFTVSSQSDVELGIDIDALHLDEGTASPVVLALGSAGEHWFDGVDLAELSEPAAAEQLLENIAASLRVSRR